MFLGLPTKGPGGGGGSSRKQACRKAVQVSSATCSLVGKGKAQLPDSSLSPNLSYQVSEREMGLARAPPWQPPLWGFRTAWRAEPAWLVKKILGSGSFSGLFPGCRAPSSPTH